MAGVGGATGTVLGLTRLVLALPNSSSLRTIPLTTIPGSKREATLIQLGAAGMWCGTTLLTMRWLTLMELKAADGKEACEQWRFTITHFTSRLRRPEARFVEARQFFTTTLTQDG